MRRRTIVLVTILLIVAAFLGTMGVWVAADVADEQAFVDSAVTSFQADGSDDALGELIARKVAERFPSLLIFEAGLSRLFALLIVTDPFLPLRIDVSEQIHAVVIDGADDAVVVDLADYREDVLTSVAAISPELAERIPDGAFAEFVVFDRGELPDGSTRVDVGVVVGWLTIGAALALVGVLVLAVRDAFVFFFAIGSALAAVGILLWISVPVGRSLAVDRAPNEAYGVLGGNLVDVLAEPLQRRATLIFIVGIAMVVVAWAGRRIRVRREAAVQS